MIDRLEFIRPTVLLLIPVFVTVVAIVGLFGLAKSLRLLQKMGQEDNASFVKRQKVGSLLVFIVALIFALVALSGPHAKSKTTRYGLRAVIVFDVSRSMGAKDYPEPLPMRIDRAKDAVIKVLRKWPEGQVGLVVFAGDALIWFPKVRDMRSLEWIIKNWVQIAMAPKEGSRLASGLEKAMDLLRATYPANLIKDSSLYFKDPETGNINFWKDPKTGKIRAGVIVVSDGVPDTFPEKEVSVFRQEGVKIIVAGVGQPNDITITLSNGKTYNVPLGEDMLVRVAAATGGEYRRIFRGNEIVEMLNSHKEFFERIEVEGAEKDLYQLPLAISLLFVIFWFRLNFRF